MPFRGIIKRVKREEDSEEFIEIPEFKEERKVNVKIEDLKEYSDTNRIQQLVREGYVIFLKIKELRSKDLTELKRAVEKLKRTCMAMGGDIVGVDEDYLILTPSFATVYRGKD